MLILRVDEPLKKINSIPSPEIMGELIGIPIRNDVYKSFKNKGMHNNLPAESRNHHGPPTLEA